jgi:hypothetical protein
MLTRRSRSMTIQHLERTGQTHDNRTMQTVVPIRHRRGATAVRHHGPGVPHRHG